MDERYKRAKELFLEVCDLDEKRRKAILDRECGGDTALRDEVESLLRHHGEPPTTAVAAPPGAGAGGPDEPADREPEGHEPEPHPRNIGPYRIIREIGRGGMGVVYLGVREGDRFKRRAAIKVLKRGLDTEEILRRFEQERQVMAALNHPGIARLHDAGRTTEGLPYFAMEYVEGQRIDEYCDTHRLRIAERLELFRQVCSAVYHVHSNLMVHRDLKPSNILVTADGQPKLLDFGIAKLINPEMSLFTGSPTAPELRVMTPEYASPEQVRGNPITVASDIYSLGVILYELLTGHRPYRIRSRVRAEIERVICNVDPDRPSTAASRVEVIEADEHESGVSTTITPELVAKVREGRPDRLRRRLTGDIDNVVLMAMRKEPQRRYGSAQEFAEDIRRHLAGLPVAARRDTTGYRFAKFVRRHRGAVATAAVVVLALVGWGATAAYSLIRVTEERNRTDQALDKALQLIGTVFELDDDLRYNSLEGRKKLAQTAQVSLEDLRPDIGEDLEFHRVVAAGYITMGDIWGGHRGEAFGDTPTALANYRNALAMFEVLLARSPGDPDLQHEVAWCHLRIGDVLRFSGDVIGAMEAFGRCLDIGRALARHNPNPEYKRDLAIWLAQVGAACKDAGRLDDAQRFYDESLVIRQQSLDENRNNADALRDVGVGYVHAAEARTLMGDYDGALERHLKAIELRERLVRTDPDNSKDQRYLALSHYFTADALLNLDRPDEAAPHVKAAVVIFEQRAEDYPSSARAARQDLALSWEIRGRLEAAMGDQDGALKSYGRWKSLATGLRELAPNNTLYAQLLAESHEHIGKLHRQSGDLPAGVTSCRQALETIRPVAEADPNDVDASLLLGRMLSGLGGVLYETGDLLGAQEALEDARSIQTSVLDESPKHARACEGLVLTLRRLSRVSAERGYPQEAIAHAREALRVAGRREAAVLRDLAAALAASGQVAAAAATAQEALDLLAGSNGPAASALREALRQDLASYNGQREG